VAANLTRSGLLFWLLLALYAVSRILQVFHGKISMLPVVALHVLPPVVFAFIHGARTYRLRGVFTFVAICVVIGNIFENMSILTGFPFGHYYFTDLMGPKIFHVPVFLGLAYVGMGYISWTLGRVILGDTRRSLAGARVVTLPLVAAFIMVAWDFAMDPVWATVLHAWIWPRGGAYFGVAVSNFLGWYLTVYVIYQLFALYLQRHSSDPGIMSARYWREAVFFYAVSAAGNLLLAITQAGPSVLPDATGTLWRVADITGVCALTSIFAMGAFAVLAFARLTEPNDQGLAFDSAGSVSPKAVAR
jgi:uncharacterized membrane protein